MRLHASVRPPSQNLLSGSMTSMSFSPSTRPGDFQYWPITLTLLDLSGNVAINGPLPPAGAGYDSLATIDLSNTSVSGPLPPSWHAFASLQRLILTDTRVVCPLTVNQTDGSVSQQMRVPTPRPHRSQLQVSVHCACVFDSPSCSCATV